MKKSELVQIIKEEIESVLTEFGAETMYFGAPGGFEQMTNGSTAPQGRHFYDLDKWKVTAMQMGAVLTDRGDDWIAILPDNTKVGTFDKMAQIGTLTM